MSASRACAARRTATCATRRWCATGGCCAPARTGYEPLLALPPLRPAAAFWALVPPWLESVLRLPLPDALPPLLDEFGSLAIRAARDLLMPFLRSPSYCLSS